jgi:hypothetical protein
MEPIRAVYQPFQSRYLNRPIRTTFTCIFPSEQLKAGEVLLLLGEFSDQTFECPLRMNSPTAQLGTDWVGELELPFAEGQSCATGIFRYRYAILPADGAVDPVNESGWRVIYSFRAQYMNTFRYDNNIPRLLAAYLVPGQKQAILRQLNADFQLLLGSGDGAKEAAPAISAPRLMTRFLLLFEGVPAEVFGRDDAEELFRSMLAASEGGGMDPKQLLCLLALFGHFGVSAAGAGSSDIGSDWCKYVIHRFPTQWLSKSALRRALIVTQSNPKDGIETIVPPWDCANDNAMREDNGAMGYDDDDEGDGFEDAGGRDDIGGRGKAREGSVVFDPVRACQQALLEAAFQCCRGWEWLRLWPLLAESQWSGGRGPTVYLQGRAEGEAGGDGFGYGAGDGFGYDAGRGGFNRFDAPRELTFAQWTRGVGGLIEEATRANTGDFASSAQHQCALAVALTEDAKQREKEFEADRSQRRKALAEYSRAAAGERQRGQWIRMYREDCGEDDRDRADAAELVREYEMQQEELAMLGQVDEVGGAKGKRFSRKQQEQRLKQRRKQRERERLATLVALAADEEAQLKRQLDSEGGGGGGIFGEDGGAGILGDAIGGLGKAGRRERACKAQEASWIQQMLELQEQARERAQAAGTARANAASAAWQWWMAGMAQEATAASTAGRRMARKAEAVLKGLRACARQDQLVVAEVLMTAIVVQAPAIADLVKTCEQNQEAGGSEGATLSSRASSRAKQALRAYATQLVSPLAARVADDSFVAEPGALEQLHALVTANAPQLCAPAVSTALFENDSLDELTTTAVLPTDTRSEDDHAGEQLRLFVEIVELSADDHGAKTVMKAVMGANRDGTSERQLLRAASRWVRRRHSQSRQSMQQQRAATIASSAGGVSSSSSSWGWREWRLRMLMADLETLLQVSILRTHARSGWKHERLDEGAQSYNRGGKGAAGASFWAAVRGAACLAGPRKEVALSVLRYGCTPSSGGGGSELFDTHTALAQGLLLQTTRSIYCQLAMSNDPTELLSALITAARQEQQRDAGTGTAQDTAAACPPLPRSTLAHDSVHAVICAAIFWHTRRQASQATGYTTGHIDGDDDVHVSVDIILGAATTDLSVGTLIGLHRIWLLLLKLAADAGDMASTGTGTDTVSGSSPIGLGGLIRRLRASVAGTVAAVKRGGVTVPEMCTVLLLASDAEDAGKSAPSDEGGALRTRFRGQQKRLSTRLRVQALAAGKQQGRPADRLAQLWIQRLPLVHLIEGTSGAAVDAPTATALRKWRCQVLQFDRRATELAHFASSCCRCGVKIESGPVDSAVANIRARSGAEATVASNSSALMLASDLEGAFDTHPSVRAIRPHLHWLFSLRRSDLFLEQWRALGEKQRETQQQKGQRGKASADEEGDGDADRPLTLIEVTDLLVPLVRQRWTELRQGYANGSASVAELMLTIGTLSSSSGGGASDGGADQVHEELSMLFRWGTKAGSKQDSDEAHDEVLELEEEHAVFAASAATAMAKQQEAAKVWSAKVQQALDAFWLARSLREFLPNLLRLREATASLFDRDALVASLFDSAGDGSSGSNELSRWQNQVHALAQQQKDKLLAALCKVYEKLHPVYTPPKKMSAGTESALAAASAATSSSISGASAAAAKAQERKWQALTLGDVASCVSNAKLLQFGGEKAVAALRDQTHAAFLGLLGAPNGIVPYLLLPDVVDQAEFRRMLEVTKANVESPRLIASLAALVEVRTLLLGLLYGKGPDDTLGEDGEETKKGEDSGGAGGVLYSDVSEFLEAYRRIPLTPTDVQRLQVLHESFYVLSSTLRENAEGPSVRAALNLARISQEGTYIFRSNRLLVSGGGGSGSGGGAGAAGGSMLVLRETNGEEWSMQALSDLRSQLLLMETAAQEKVNEKLLERFQREPQRSGSLAPAIQAIVGSFVAQLPLLGDIGELQKRLYEQGYPEYQDGYEWALPCGQAFEYAPSQESGGLVGEGSNAQDFDFNYAGLLRLEQRLRQLRRVGREWQKAVASARTSHPLLNFFTLRELLELDRTLRGLAQKNGGNTVAAVARGASPVPTPDTQRVQAKAKALLEPTAAPKPLTKGPVEGFLQKQMRNFKVLLVMES